MQSINFEAVIESGHIKIPDKYSILENKKVIVEIFNNNFIETINKKDEIVKFIHKYKSLLKSTKLNKNISIKDIKTLRLKDKYDL